MLYSKVDQIECISSTKPKIFRCPIWFTMFRSKVIKWKEMDKVGVNKPEDILSDVHKHTQKKILK